MEECERILKQDGYIFLKINPYITNENLDNYELTHLRDNLFVKDGILRLRRLSTSQWHKELEHFFEIERYLEFPYPWQDGMNRLWLLKKKR